MQPSPDPTTSQHGPPPLRLRARLFWSRFRWALRKRLIQVFTSRYQGRAWAFVRWFAHLQSQYLVAAPVLSDNPDYDRPGGPGESRLDVRTIDRVSQLHELRDVLPPTFAFERLAEEIEAGCLLQLASTPVSPGEPSRIVGYRALRAHGFAALGTRVTLPERCLFIEHVELLPTERGKGYALALRFETRRYFGARGYRVICGLVHVVNAPSLTAHTRAMPHARPRILGTIHRLRLLGELWTFYPSGPRIERLLRTYLESMRPTAAGASPDVQPVPDDPSRSTAAGSMRAAR